MIVAVNDKWRLKHDGLQWIVQEGRFNSRTGKVYWRSKWFFRTLEKAVLAMLHEIVERHEAGEIPLGWIETFDKFMQRLDAG